jgi:hypothetical protein
MTWALTSSATTWAPWLGALALGDGVFGDGMAYQLGPVGGFGYDADAQALLSGYADASLADAYFSGPDFSAVEGEAILAGPVEYRRQAGAPAVQAAAQRTHASRHAGKHCHRWGWLIKALEAQSPGRGFQETQKLAALDPNTRCAIIDQARRAAVNAYHQQMAQHQRSTAALPAGVAAFGPTAPGAAPGVGDALGYGALAVADY